MRITFILKNLSDTFYNGDEKFSCFGPGLLQQTNSDKFKRLTSSDAKDLGITCQIGHCNAFRDKVELNQLMRGGHSIEFKLEPRRGYKLAIFEIKPL